MVHTAPSSPLLPGPHGLGAAAAARNAPLRAQRLWAMLLLVLGLLLAQSHSWASAPALELRDEVRAVNAWPAVTVLADPSRQWSVQEVLARTAEFTRPPGTSGTLGVRNDAMWLRVPVTLGPGSDGIWILDVDYPVLQRVDIYVTADGQVLRHAALGSLRPFDQRPLHSRSHALAMQLRPGQAYTLLLRVETQGAMVLPITLSKATAWHSRALDEQMLQGILTGLALCLLIYSLAQWVNLRDVLFLQYALLITGSLLFSLHLFGIGTQYLWPDNPWMESHAAGLSALLATCGSFLFISQALAGHLRTSRLRTAMRAGAVLCVVLAASYAAGLLSTRAVTGVVSLLGLVPALMGIPGAVRRARSGDPVGMSLLLAWLVYFLATATVIGVIRGWVPVNFWTLHSFQFGATLDMLLFMRVLGLRTKALRMEALDAHRERDVMRSLAHTDPLTGLPNRRGLNMALASALPHCSTDNPLAVYVMDLDGFKPVNDQHGHDVGDELLVAVTRRLQGHLRQTDVIARLGGDEFVVMAGQLSGARQAHDLGQKLLDAFHAPFTLDGRVVRVGLTIGYAIAPLDAQDAVGLLKLADAAMYSGKQSGKFCVRRNTGDLALSST